jgi:hypothetical protein
MCDLGEKSAFSVLFTCENCVYVPNSSEFTVWTSADVLSVRLYRCAVGNMMSVRQAVQKREN